MYVLLPIELTYTFALILMHYTVERVEACVFHGLIRNRQHHARLFRLPRKSAKGGDTEFPKEIT